MSYTTDTQFQAALAQLDLTSVMARLAEETGLEGEDLVTAETLYRQFLTLKHKYMDKVIVPTKLVDEVWHTHITDTRKYMADCEALFGMFFHHTPKASAEDELEGIENNKNLYKEEFGESLPIMTSVKNSSFSGFASCF